MHGNLLIILVLRAEGCSGIFQPNIISFGCGWKIVRLRTENRLPEIDFPFGAERKTKMKEAVINYKTMFYEILEMPFTFSRMSVNMMGTPVSFTQRLYLPS